MLCHALQLLTGKPIYAEPSVDFISYLYTPLYPFVVSALGRVAGLGYTVGRVVSLLGFFAASALAVRVVIRQVGGVQGVLWGIAAAGLIAASFPHTGAWYDLVRNDSLYLGLVVAGLYLLCYGHRSWPKLIAAGVLLGLGFLTKQTTSLFIVMSGLALLLFNWRRLPVHVAVVGLVAGGTVLLLDHSTNGWFWTYIYKLHQGHDLYWDRALKDTPLILWRASPVAMSLVGLWAIVSLVALVRRRGDDGQRAGRLYWLAVAVTGVLVACIGFGTQWAAENAFIPGLFFVALAAGVGAGDLVRRARALGAVGAGICALLVGRRADRAADRPALRSRRAPADPRRPPGGARLHRAAASDRGADPDAVPPLLSAPGRQGHQLPPDGGQRRHPRRPPLPAGHPPAGVRDQHYAAIILDNPPRGRYDFVLMRYKLEHYFRANETARVFTGYRVRPRYLLVPKRPSPPPPAGERRVFDFESGHLPGLDRRGLRLRSQPRGRSQLQPGAGRPLRGAFPRQLVRQRR